MCTSDWLFSGRHIRPDRTNTAAPGAELHTIIFGGPFAGVFVKGADETGSSYPIDERTLFIHKVGGSTGSTIVHGDTVTISTFGNWFFRIKPNGHDILADALADQAAVFTVELNEVRPYLGWRPAAIKCKFCSTVKGTVLVFPDNRPIVGAVVKLTGTSFTGTTDSNGEFTLTDGKTTCVPEGDYTLAATHETHMSVSSQITVRTDTTTTIGFELSCRTISGKVIDENGVGVAGVVVSLNEAIYPHRPYLRDQNDPSSGVVVATDTQGDFVLSCIPSGQWLITTRRANAAVTLGGGSLANVIIRWSCGSIIGTVKDDETGLGIAGADVWVSGSIFAGVTDENGAFLIVCVRPDGQAYVNAEAEGYQPATSLPVNVPASGNTTPMDIRLRRSAAPIETEIMIVLRWGPTPWDLDAHLSGPDTVGGRFHLYFDAPAPVPFASLSTDDQDGLGPEEIRIVKTGSPQAFVPGQYRLWIHNYIGSSFLDSGAEVEILGDGVSIARFLVSAATGNPEDDLWHVANIQLGPSGAATVVPFQQFKPGSESTVL